MPDDFTDQRETPSALGSERVKKLSPLNPSTPKSDFIEFTLSNANRFYLSKGDPLGVKSPLKAISHNPFTPKSDFIDFTLTPDDFTCQRETPCE